jgi:alkylation response protein AidB-like acyl-CoA dehydrogenase
MALVLTEDQQILQQTARDFVASRSSLKRIRALRDAKDPLGFSRDLWREMAGLGWAGIVVPETHGGAGMGFADLMVVMEELGRGLMPEPMLSMVASASAILFSGSEEQKRALLPAIATGDSIVALAWQEAASRYDPRRITAHAERVGGGFRLSGEKFLVLDGHAADHLIVSALTTADPRDPDVLTLFAIDARARGVTSERQWLLDGRGAARIRLDGVEAPESAVLGGVGRGAEVLEHALDRATAALTAEMLGSMLTAFEMTIEYLKTRKQFGVLIGTFQALKHRAANVYTEIELTRSAVFGLHRAIDERSADVPDLVDVAKARASDSFLLTANEAVQMHGGIGMTDEHDIGFFLKRARAAEVTFGDAAWHRGRYAARHGY